MKNKKKFKIADYRIIDKKGRKFAVRKSQSGPHECWRVISKDFAAKNTSNFTPFFFVFKK